MNAIQIMPVAEFAGDYSWGYNPANIFAVESIYGGPDGFKMLVRGAHQRGLGVILDVVYNHFGPSDLNLWQFDGWQENEKGGIYFYNDHRAETPWGSTRPDYGREEVRDFIHDNARMWLEEYHVDGLRYDSTLYIRCIDGNEANEIPDGWMLMQRINGDIRAHFPRDHHLRGPAEQSLDHKANRGRRSRFPRPVGCEFCAPGPRHRHACPG